MLSALLLALQPLPSEVAEKTALCREALRSGATTLEDAGLEVMPDDGDELKSFRDPETGAFVIWGSPFDTPLCGISFSMDGEDRGDRVVAWVETFADRTPDPRIARFEDNEFDYQVSEAGSEQLPLVAIMISPLSSR